MTRVSACVCMSLGIALAGGDRCSAAPVEKRPGDGIVFADADTTARKLGLEWKDLDRHIADAVAQKEKPLTKANGEALGKHLRDARAAVLVGDLKLARGEAAKAQAIDAKFPEAEFLHGVILFETEDPQAEAVWKSWVERNPDDLFARNYLAQLLCESSDEKIRAEGASLVVRNWEARPNSVTAQIIRLRYGHRSRDLSEEEQEARYNDIVALVRRLDSADQTVLTQNAINADRIDRTLSLDEAQQLLELSGSVPPESFPAGLQTAVTLLYRVAETSGPLRNVSLLHSRLKQGRIPKLNFAERTR